MANTIDPNRAQANLQGPTPTDYAGQRAASQTAAYQIVNTVVAQQAAGSAWAQQPASPDASGNRLTIIDPKNSSDQRGAGSSATNFHAEAAFSGAMMSGDPHDTARAADGLALSLAARMPNAAQNGYNAVYNALNPKSGPVSADDVKSATSQYLMSAGYAATAGATQPNTALDTATAKAQQAVANLQPGNAGSRQELWNSINDVARSAGMTVPSTPATSGSAGASSNGAGGTQALAGRSGGSASSGGAQPTQPGGGGQPPAPHPHHHGPPLPLPLP